METQSLTKQFLIQVAISVVASVVTCFIMNKLMQPKDDGTTTALGKSLGATTPAGSATTTTTVTTPTV